MNVSLQFTFKGKNNVNTTFTSEILTAEEALALSYELEKIGNVKQLYFVDEQNTYWKKKAFIKLMEIIDEKPHDIVAYFDGGYNKETMAAGIGVVIYYTMNGKRYRIRKNASLQELQSNNEAEYAALWNVLVELEHLGVTHNKIHIKGDSQVVIQQMKEEWAVYEQEFIRWIERIDAKINKLNLDVEFELIGRKENKEADQLANQALEGISIESEMEVQN